MKFVSSLFRIFPPPAVLRFLHCGVSVSDEGVHYVVLKPKGDTNEVVSWGFIPLPPDAVKAGIIERPDAVTTALSKVSSTTATRYCAATIPDEKAYIFKTSVQPVAGSQVPDLVALKIQEMVPIAAPNALFDYTVVKRDAEGVHVVVRVAHQKVSEAYFKVFKTSGLMPLLFKIESQALADACISSDEAPSILMKMSDSRTLFAIVAHGAVYFSTSIDFGMSRIVDHVSKTLNIGADQVQKVLFGGETTKQFSHEQVMFSLTNGISVIRDEVIKLQDYWKSRGDDEADIGRVYMSGSLDGAAGIEKYLSDSFGLKVEVANVWRSACDVGEYIPPIEHKEASAYGSAIGVALPHSLHW